MESYKNDKSVCEVIINIAEEMENKNLETVAHCHFVSSLCDRSTDLSTTETPGLGIQPCYEAFSGLRVKNMKTQ